MTQSTVSSATQQYKSGIKENSILQEEEWFDLQPIEKKLCVYSLGLGILLLFIFILLFEVL
ncbi:hypothetical protein NXG27_02845 [Megasphaera paucivorans]|jgi:hypothetical protein|uniref:Uncharacterized protein n=1 Tax=Megasphaera paucivorans TaxID=349095 RepID=A0A1H0B221_9FIRM|nr:hypothetical protein [Megasphaera paucivorans]SDN39717.1 hypothetical protein SAMN05660299_02654 [Megasphaera paucivorans]